MPVLFGTRKPFRNIERGLNEKEKKREKEKKHDKETQEDEEKKDKGTYEEDETPIFKLNVDYSEDSYSGTMSRKINNLECNMVHSEFQIALSFLK